MADALWNWAGRRGIAGQQRDRLLVRGANRVHTGFEGWRTMTRVVTRRVAINGIEVAYSEAGEGGRPLVLVHGFTGHRDDFIERLPELALDGRVLAPDLRGHGDATHTGRAETFSFEQLVDDLRAFLDALAIERCDLLGHSLGGMVVLRFVLAYPKRVASLVLMNTAPFSPDGFLPEVFAKAGEIAIAKGMARLQDLVAAAARNADTPADRQVEKWAARYWAHHERRYIAMDPVAYGALGAEMVGQASIEGRLGEITCPTTVLVGANDSNFLRGADVMAAAIPAARRRTFPDAGHHPHMENAKAWSEALHEHRSRTSGEP
jgi:2-succinyl-6-hydroxy-2,4-cyclohexadiene-1-carboxylate synthase